jgi:hypothetical protein
MTGPVETYLAAHAAFRAADRAVDELMRVVQRIGDALRGQRGRLVFYGTAIGLPWPPGAANHALPVLDGEWPDAARLQQALADWHTAHAAARDAWAALPTQFQPALPHPPAALRTAALEDGAWETDERPALAQMED